ncbi:hypothetical protein H5410_031309, partial [Solanum commersonii]
NFDAAVTWQSHVTPRGSGWNSRFKNKCFKRLTSREFRGESSGDLETREEASFECGKRGDRSRGKDPHRESSTLAGFVGYGFLVRLSMFRHLFIDLLEYGGVWVLSMLNFYSSCLRPYFGKVLDYDNMSLDIIEYPYLV